MHLALAALPALLALTGSEMARAYAARALGDKTPERANMLSLNPLHYVDLLGTIVLPALTLMTGALFFGWAKPVPVSYGSMRDPKRGVLLVAAASIGALVGLAIAWVILARVIKMADLTSLGAIWLPMAVIGMQLSIGFAAFCLLPIPPLAGAQIIYGLLPRQQGEAYWKLAPYGMWIAIALALTGLLRPILGPINAILYQFLSLFTG